MSLNITIRELSRTTIIECDGRITLGEGASSIRQTVQQVLDRGARHIVLNLQRVPYVDSAGLGELVGVYTTVRNRGGDVVLVGVQGRLLSLLQITKLTTVFRSFDDEAAAVDSFSGAASARN